MRHLHSVACILVLAGGVANAQPAAPSASSLALRAEKVIASRLDTPADAQFRNVHTTMVNGAPLVCGEFTSDKASADYVAYNMFIYDPAHLKGVVHFAGTGRGIGADLWSEDGRHDLDHNAGKRGAQSQDYDKLTAATMDYIPACISQS